MLKAHGALESKIHETLYTNIYMLTQIYPPDENFLKVFKKDMFVKNNTTASQQVIYYLLSILNPSIIKEKLPSWPCFDRQYERQYRTEVMKYLNELNGLYENANIPTITASHLISPGGMKFAKYMLKLSILVLHEHLQRTSEKADTILLRPNIRRNNTDAEKQIKRLTVLTKSNNKENEKLMRDYNNKRLKAMAEADMITQKLKDVQQNIPLLQEKLRSLQSEKSESGESLNEAFNGKIKVFKRGVLKIENISDQIKKIREAVTYLSRKDLALQHNPERSNNDEVDLIELFRYLNLSMEEYCLTMRTFSDQELDQYIRKFTSYNEDIVKLKNELINIQQESIKFYDNIKSSGANILKSSGTPCSSGSTLLAVPLGNSTSE